MAFFSIFQILSLFTLSLFMTGLLNIYLSDKENACEMTYMFEYPQFVKIQVPENENYPQYSLYAYSEGRFTERTRKMRFDGIPVLFLPGNVGSHKQVRSMASVALRKSLPASKHSFHFDYFAVDFNDERSGLFGGVLTKQTEFSSKCLEAILNLYETNDDSRYPRPTSIILIGHSMGGIIAKSLVTYAHNRNIINLIMTLATPHQMPVINADSYMNAFYKRIDEHWDLKITNTSNLLPIAKIWQSKVLITIGGGVRDIMVASALTASPHSDVQTLTTAIPGVWLSTDHLCIVWCKQLVLVLNRLLFKIIDPSTKQLTADTNHIINMGKHFLKPGHSLNDSYYNMQAEFLPDAHWHEDSRRTYSVTHEKGVRKTWYYMVRLTDQPLHETVTFEVVNLDDKDWLFGCQAKYVHGQYRVCLNGRHLSQFGRWAVSSSGRRRIATLDLKALHASYPHWSHIILRVSPTYKPVRVTVDLYGNSLRSIKADVPALYNAVRRTVIERTSPGAISYDISLSGLEMLYQAHQLLVEPLPGCPAEHHASARLAVPWAEGHDVYHQFTQTMKAPMRIRLMSSNDRINNSTRTVMVHLTLDPLCTYSVSIAASPYDALGQLSRHYATSLPAYFAAVVLLVLRHWAANMASKGEGGESFHSALCGEHVKPYYIVMAARMGITVVASVPFFKNKTSSLLIGGNLSQGFFLLPLLLFLVALGLAHVLGAACWGLLIFSGQLTHRVLFRIAGGGRAWDWLSGALRKAPGAAGALLLALCSSSCGAAALAVGSAFYFFLLTTMYEDYLEDIIYFIIGKIAKKFRRAKPETDKGKTEENLKTEGDLSIMAAGDGVVDNAALVKSETCTSDKIEEPKTALCDTAEDSLADEPVKALADSDQTLSEATPEVKETKTKEDKSGFVTSPLHFHFAMFFVWISVTLLNVPVLITWAHNFKYNKVLENDPSFIPGIIMCGSAALLWQMDVPKPNIKFYDVISKLVYATAVIVLMATPLALYRLNYILPVIFAIITLHQMFSFEEDEEKIETVEQDESKPLDDSSATSKGEKEPDFTSGHRVASSLIDEDAELMDRFNNLREKFETE